MTRRAAPRRTRRRRAIWSPLGIQPLDGPRAGDAPLLRPEPLLAAEAIREACRRPLRSIIVHTVADRLADITERSDVEILLEHLDVVSVVGRLRLLELAGWLCRFGVEYGQIEVGLALLRELGHDDERGRAEAAWIS